MHIIRCCNIYMTKQDSETFLVVFDLFFFSIWIWSFKQTSIFQFFKSLLNLCGAGLISRIMIVVKKSSLGPDGIGPLSTWFIKANNSKSPLSSTWSFIVAWKSPINQRVGPREWLNEKQKALPFIPFLNSCGAQAKVYAPITPNLGRHDTIVLLTSVLFSGQFPQLNGVYIPARLGLIFTDTPIALLVSLSLLTPLYYELAQSIHKK